MMKTVLDVDLRYRPRAWQKEAHLQMRGAQRGLLICSRQVGKSVMSVVELIDRTLKGPPGSATCYICPAQTQARRIAWPELKKRLAPMGEHVNFSETQLVVTLPGDRRMYILGAESGENIRGSSFHTVVIDEFDNISDELYRNVILPTTNAYNEKAFIMFVGTLSGGDSSLWRMYMERRDDPMWACKVVPATKAGVFDPAWLEDRRRELGESAYQREMECNPHAPVENSVLGREIAEAENDGRVQRIPYRSGVDVYTSFDLGVRDFSAVWGCMHYGSWIEYLFYREFSGLSIVEIMARLRNEFPSYQWGEATLPHDAGNRALASVATATSVADMFRDHWPGDYYVVKPAPAPMATLQATRKNMQKTMFDSRNCEKGLLRLKSARYVVDPKTGTVTDRILHDDNSHALDAFRLGMWRLESLGDSREYKALMGQDWTNNAAYFE